MNAWDRLKQEFDKDPVKVMVATALVVTATAKLLDARTNAAYRKTWVKEVSRRERGR